MELLCYDDCLPFLPKISTAKCLKVYDGDTIHLGIILPEPYGATRFSCRLLGIDTPELRSKDSSQKSLAREAREIVKSLILHKIVNVRVTSMDKYGRLLVRISVDSCEDLSQFLINEKVAVPYNGGRKHTTDWHALMKEHIALRSNRVIQDALVLANTKGSQNRPQEDGLGTI